MKYLKYLKESIISDKIDRLEDLTYDLKDNDLMVDVIKDNPPTFRVYDGPEYIASINNNSRMYDKNKCVFILIYKVKNKQLEKFTSDELSIIDEFRETLKSYKLDRSISGGNGFFLFSINKRDLYNSNL
jgi:c-di-AMP phosphodiesterase-like protein